ncbi:MAG TPA: hypothetical protein VFV87_18270 [Pirellulaceae bacterium]|nr:hypothetical protein [Pirellulaceae bacterium]
MKSTKASLILPVLLVFLGIGWLLTELKILPPVNWAWSLGLAAIGVLAFIVSGFDKVSIVIGPFFLVAAGLSLLRQQGWLAEDVELPILVTLAGALLLTARLPAIPLPSWLIQDGGSVQKA